MKIAAPQGPRFFCVVQNLSCGERLSARTLPIVGQLLRLIFNDVTKLGTPLIQCDGAISDIPRAEAAWTFVSR
jgi:hypothetical protein